MQYIEEKLHTPVRYECEVLVAGGGVAGIAAALAAARSGRSVLLCERSFLLGGLASAGLISIYLPLCDGLGRQVSFGLAEELLRLSVLIPADRAHGYRNWIEENDPAHRTEKDPRFLVNFNPHFFAIHTEQLLRSSGVKILYGTTAVGATTQDGKIKCVLFENKSGRFAVRARSVVDATGDADIAAFAGAPTALPAHGNIMAAWYCYDGKTGYTLNTLGVADNPEEDRDSTGENDRRLPTDRRFSGLDGEENSEFTEISHAHILRDIKKRRESDPTLFPVTIPTIPQFRMTRRLSGAATLDEREVKVHFADSVGMVSDWRRRGPVFEVPFGTLYTPLVKNLLCAGRCTSVTDAMWDIMRVIPCCAVTGEAAGVAAALSDDMTALPVETLQAELTARGVRIHGDFF